MATPYRRRGDWPVLGRDLSGPVSLFFFLLLVTSCSFVWVITGAWWYKQIMDDANKCLASSVLRIVCTGLIITQYVYMLVSWWSVLACSLVAVESNFWCADHTALWTGDSLGEDEWDAAHSFCLLCLSFVASCLPASNGRLMPVQAVSLAGLCNIFLECYNHTFLPRAHWRRLPWACVCLPSLKYGQPSKAALEAR